MRKEYTRRRREQEAAWRESTVIESGCDWTRLRPIIDDALSKLSAPDREAILLRFFEGRSLGDMGLRFQISPDAARMRIDRAMEKLRAVLENRGVNSIPAALAMTLATQAAGAAPSGLLASVSTAALSGVAAAGGFTTVFNLMSGMKIVSGTAALVAFVATSTAILKHTQAEKAETRVEASVHELNVLQAQLARAEEQRAAAERRAADVENDNTALLTAVAAARAQRSAAATQTSSGLARDLSPEDPWAHALHALFPTGIVAVLGDRTITVDDVKREAAPFLPKVQQSAGNSEELRQRLYQLQNNVIADLVTRQLLIKEFHHQRPDEVPKQIPAEMVDRVLSDRIKEQFDSDQARFLAHLQIQGLSPAQYRQTVEEDIISSYMRGQQRKFASATNAKAKPAAP